MPHNTAFSIIQWRFINLFRSGQVLSVVGTHNQIKICLLKCMTYQLLWSPETRTVCNRILTARQEPRNSLNETSITALWRTIQATVDQQRTDSYFSVSACIDFWEGNEVMNVRKGKNMCNHDFFDKTSRSIHTREHEAGACCSDSFLRSCDLTVFAKKFCSLDKPNQFDAWPVDGSKWPHICLLTTSLSVVDCCVLFSFQSWFIYLFHSKIEPISASCAYAYASYVCTRRSFLCSSDSTLCSF